MPGKIVLEEHFALPDTIDDSERYFTPEAWPAMRRRLLDFHEERIRQMDRFGIQLAVLSLNAPGVQGVLDTREAIELFAREGPELYALGYTLGEWPPASGKRQVTKWELVPEKVIVKRQAAAQLSRATDADINVPCPEGLSLLGYQKAGVAFALQVFGECD